jgi:16S rRNA (guanine1516-N2)-methyltransferase
MPDPVGICPASQHPELIKKAKQQALHWQLPYFATMDAGLALVQHSTHLALCQLEEPQFGQVVVDFASDSLTYRRNHPEVKKEAIVKAVGCKGNVQPYIVDATAGMATDAFILASVGCRVCLIERSPVVAALLADGVERSQYHPALSAWLPQSMELIHGDSEQLLNQWQGNQPDVVYLDPMFPHRKKSARVKKEMYLFQTLLGADTDSDDLLPPALNLAKNRVVVKRPKTAPYLANRQPSMSIESKKHRFDVYLTHLNGG